MDGTVVYQSSTDNDSPTMTEAIKMITKAYDLCFSNKFLQAKADIEPWINKSMYHAIAHSSIMC
ncbi:unnamed protein product, partial [Pocillopora meandrina]